MARKLVNLRLSSAPPVSGRNVKAARVTEVKAHFEELQFLSRGLGALETRAGEATAPNAFPPKPCQLAAAPVPRRPATPGALSLLARWKSSGRLGLSVDEGLSV